MKRKMTLFWRTRQPRERLLLALCLALALFATLYLARSSALRWQAQQAKHLQQQQLAWQQMQQLDARMRAAMPSPVSATDLSRISGLSLHPRVDGGFSATVSDIEFSALIKALIVLEQRQRLQATQLRLEQHGSTLRLMRLELSHAR